MQIRHKKNPSSEKRSKFTGLSEVLDSVRVNGKITNGSAELGAHITDGSSISDAEESNSRSEELHKLSNDADLSEILRDC